MATIKDLNRPQAYHRTSRETIYASESNLLNTYIGDLLNDVLIQDVTITYRNGDYVELRLEEVDE